MKVGYYMNKMHPGDKLTDVQKKYPEKQEEWKIFSEKTIEEFVQRLPDFIKLEGAYAFLAGKRMEIAQRLEQGKEEKTTGLFGRFREEHYGAKEEVSLNDPNGAWHHQAQAIFDAVTKLIPPETSAEPNAHYYSHSANSNYPNITIKNHYHGQEILPNTNCTVALSSITLFENGLRLNYPAMNKYNVKGDRVIADMYYQKLLNWDNPKDTYGFLQIAGRLSHLLAHLLWVKRGNASIIEWTIRGLAKHQGIELGAFNTNNMLSWDWQALVTPDPVAYGLWYCQNAFEIAKPQSHSKWMCFSCGPRTSKITIYPFDVSEELVRYSSSSPKNK